MLEHETAEFRSDPGSFMTQHLIRIICGRDNPGVYSFGLVENTAIVATRTNRSGARIRYLELQETPDGTLQMWFLPYVADGVRQMTLPRSGADLMTTSQMAGCSFGFSSASSGSDIIVTHHNARSMNNDPRVIEHQRVDVGDGRLSYFHQSGYRKRSLFGRGFKSSCQATVVGKRDMAGRWIFYAQSKKDINHDAAELSQFSLKGTKQINT